MSGADLSLRLVPTPEEVENLKTLVREINAGKGPPGLPYSPRIIRRYFFERCFGNGEGPAPLADDQAQRMTTHCGKPISVGALRAETLSSIEDLILFLMSPVGEGLLRNNGALKEPSSNRVLHQQHIEDAEKGAHLSDPTTSHQTSTSLLDDTTPLARVSGTGLLGHLGDAIRQGKTSSHGERLLHRPVNPNGQNLAFGKGQPHGLFSDSGVANMVEAGTDARFSIAPSGHQNDSLTSAFERMKMSLVEKSPSSYMTKDSDPNINQIYHGERGQRGLEDPASQLEISSNGATHSTIHSPEQAPWSSMHNSSQSTPFQSPQHLHYVGDPDQQFSSHSYRAQLTPAQVQYTAFQQMQQGAHQPMPFSWNPINLQMNLPQLPPGFQTSFQSPVGGHCGPNGIWVPSDRYVRPPATNRIAPLFAQSGAWQANQPRQMPIIPQPLEWQNRFASPTIAMPRDNRKLSYLEGSDDMYPQVQLNSGASVRFQNLTRNQPPSLDVATEENNIPFAETARTSKPAEWGVMKIGNVSTQARAS